MTRFGLVLLLAIVLAGCAKPREVELVPSSREVEITVPRYEGGSQNARLKLSPLDGDVLQGVEVCLPYDYRKFVTATLDAEGILSFPLTIPAFMATERYLSGQIVVYMLGKYHLVGASGPVPLGFMEETAIPLSVQTKTYEKSLSTDSKINDRYCPSGMRYADYKKLYREIDPLPGDAKKRLSDEIEFWLTHRHVTGDERVRLEAIRNIIEKEASQ